MTRDAQNMERQTIMRKYAEARPGRVPEMTIEKELFVTPVKMIKMHKWQHRSLTC